MSSRDGSAFAPSAVTVTPLTLTRPSSISFSLARRDATPACDRIFCNRSTVSPSQQVAPERREIHDIADVRRLIGFGMRDQTADEQPHLRVAAPIVRQEIGRAHAW